jgi:tRNA(Leu) C34 or U34 (ribose-2'-O)-methylase TrmL
LADAREDKRDSLSAYGLSEMPLAIEIILPRGKGRRSLNLSASVTFGGAKL